MAVAPDPRTNHLIASVSADAYDRLAPHLELVYLRRTETLHEVTGVVDAVRFPTSALISAFVDTQSGASAEVALIGNDGALGIMTALTGARLNFRAAVDTEGYAYRVKMSRMRMLVESSGSLHEALLQYASARTMQIALNAVCNTHHSVQQRLCRALLTRLNKVQGNCLHITQQMLANILGARRPGVTEAAAALRSAGAIEYRRGRLMVLNREVLQERTCECYVAVETQTECLIGSPAARASIPRAIS